MLSESGKAKLRQRLRDGIDLSSQYIVSIEQWNLTHADAMPADAELWRLKHYAAKRALTALDRGDTPEAIRLFGEVAELSFRIIETRCHILPE